MVCMDWRAREKMLLTFVGGREATGQTGPPAHRSPLESQSCVRCRLLGSQLQYTSNEISPAVYFCHAKDQKDSKFSRRHIIACQAVFRLKILT